MAIPAEQKAEFELSFGIAERFSEILKAKGLSQKDFAKMLNKRDAEINGCCHLILNAQPCGLYTTLQCKPMAAMRPIPPAKLLWQ